MNNDWITGEKFVELADFVYSSNHTDDCNKLANTLDLNLLKDGSKIYCHTFYVKELLEIIAGVKKSLILITHNSDDAVNETCIFTPNIKKWFAQNVDIINPVIESIPIGLENSRWFPNIHKKEQMTNKLNEVKTCRSLMYMNFTTGTNVKERMRLYQMFEGKPWVTSARGTNGERFDKYIDDVYHHRFVLCPQGNGIDTVRLWESLYMNTIPIVKGCINTLFYKDLPICFVDDWEEINERFLNSELQRIVNQKWNLSKLTFEYWKTKILEV
jgi:hypothetical protein